MGLGELYTILMRVEEVLCRVHGCFLIYSSASACAPVVGCPRPPRASHRPSGLTNPTNRRLQLWIFALLYCITVWASVHVGRRTPWRMMRE